MGNPSETIPAHAVPGLGCLAIVYAWRVRREAQGGLPRTLKKGMACIASPQAARALTRKTSASWPMRPSLAAQAASAACRRATREQRGLRAWQRGHLGRAHGNFKMGAHVLAAGTDVLGNLESGLVGGGRQPQGPRPATPKACSQELRPGWAAMAAGHGGPKPAELCRRLVTKALGAVCLGGAGSDQARAGLSGRSFSRFLRSVDVTSVSADCRNLSRAAWKTEMLHRR